MVKQKPWRQGIQPPAAKTGSHSRLAIDQADWGKEYTRKCLSSGALADRRCRGNARSIGLPRLALLMVVTAVARLPRRRAAGDQPLRSTPRQPQRDDAVPGCVELSDGSIHSGAIYLTRDKRLKIYDRQLAAATRDALAGDQADRLQGQEEWMEKEWTFKETTSDEKHLHRPQLSGAGISAHDHLARRPHYHRPAFGHRVCSAAAMPATWQHEPEQFRAAQTQ